MLPDVAPGCWKRLPNTRLNLLKPPPESMPPGASGWAGILTEGTGCIVPDDECMLVNSGGHGDQSFNGIPRLHWKGTPAVDFEWPGTPVSQIPPIGEPKETYPDGNPASRHTRDGIEFIPSMNGFVMHAGSLWSGSGGNSYHTWMWQRASVSWRRFASAPDALSTNAYSALDPVDESMFIIRPASDGRIRLYRYRPQVDTWHLLANTVMSAEHRRTGAYDAKRRRVLLGGMGTIIVWDLTQTPIVARVARSAMGGYFGRPGWGFEIDPVLDKGVIWPQGAPTSTPTPGAPIFLLDLDTYEVEQVPLPAESDVPPPGRGGGFSGPHGRFRRDPETGLYITIYHVEYDAYVYRLPSLGGAKMFFTPTALQWAKVQE